MYTRTASFGFLDAETKVDLTQRFINFDLSRIADVRAHADDVAVLDFCFAKSRRTTSKSIAN